MGMGDFLKGFLRKGFLSKATKVNPLVTPAQMGSAASPKSILRQNPIGGYTKIDAPSGSHNVSNFLKGTKVPDPNSLREARARRFAAARKNT